jgi:hypothetical protein
MIASASRIVTGVADPPVSEFGEGGKMEPADWRPAGFNL